MNKEIILRITVNQLENASFDCGKRYRINAGYRIPALDSFCQYLWGKFPNEKEKITVNWLKGWEQQHKLELNL